MQNNKTTHGGVHDHDLRFGYRRRLGRLRSHSPGAPTAARCGSCAWACGSFPKAAPRTNGTAQFGTAHRTRLRRRQLRRRRQHRRQLGDTLIAAGFPPYPHTGQRLAQGHGGRSLTLAQNRLGPSAGTGRGGPGAIPSGPDRSVRRPLPRPGEPVTPEGGESTGA